MQEVAWQSHSKMSNHISILFMDKHKTYIHQMQRQLMTLCQWICKDLEQKFGSVSVNDDDDDNDDDDNYKWYSSVLLNRYGMTNTQHQRERERVRWF